MANYENAEDLGIPKSPMSDFAAELKVRLSFLAGLTSYKEFNLTREDIIKPILCIGKPGLGKTCIVMAAVNEINELLPPEKKFGFKKILLGQTVVGSLTGIPVVNQNTGKLIKAQAAELPDRQKDGEYGVLFLDEITTADEAQIQPALGLCDDSRCIGEYTLPDHWLVVGAGNGPDCANFVKLDDMILSRFSPYDISFDYKKDWRPWAHQHNINPLIIAYLNFKPENCIAIESTEMDDAGKMFACPRTWERLSIELKMRKACGRPVRVSEMANFAGRIVGKRVGREFAVFSEYNVDLPYEPEKIVAGREKDPSTMPEQQFHILLERCIAIMKGIMKDTVVNESDYPSSTYQAMANMVDWFIKMENFSLDLVLNAISEMRTNIPMFKNIINDEAFSSFTNSFDEFIMNHIELFAETATEDLCL